MPTFYPTGMPTFYPTGIPTINPTSNLLSDDLWIVIGFFLICHIICSMIFGCQILITTAEYNDCRNRLMYLSCNNIYVYIILYLLYAVLLISLSPIYTLLILASICVFGPFVMCFAILKEEIENVKINIHNKNNEILNKNRIENDSQV